jgi:hypothetical protein
MYLILRIFPEIMRWMNRMSECLFIGTFNENYQIKRLSVCLEVPETDTVF